jgi:aminoglycoside phosphotransferase family enzyme/predicted kinase
MEEAHHTELTRQGLQLIETHISRVYLSDEQVFKTKRPVNLGFLDFRALDDRERACEAEVLLNRRLAPDVYLGVVALVRDAQGKLRFVAREQVVGRTVLDYAVHMRRLRDEARADVRLARGLLDRHEVEQIASLLAHFHQQARGDARTALFGSVDRICEIVEENFSQVEELVRDHLVGAELESIRVYQRNFLRDRREVLASRAHAGFVRDGHGDLRLEHIYRNDDGSHLVIDCIEFNERFRFADVCADLAFLSMDLRSHGRDDLADLLLARYAEESGDYGLYELLDFYESYRAFVRGKVASFLAHDANVQSETTRAAQAAARRHFLLALSSSRPRLERPRAIVCMGMIASGKSTLAQALATRLGFGVLSADRVRKRLLSVPLTTPVHDSAYSGGYSPEVTERVYTLLCERAVSILASGRSVILDATFRERRQRTALREQVARLGSQVLFLECRCERDAAMERLRARALTPNVSDGRGEIYDAVAAGFQPVDELDSASHLPVDTNPGSDEALARVLKFLS